MSAPKLRELPGWAAAVDDALATWDWMPRGLLELAGETQLPIVPPAENITKHLVLDALNLCARCESSARGHFRYHGLRVVRGGAHG